jgi:hypothetical protein
MKLERPIDSGRLGRSDFITSLITRETKRSASRRQRPALLVATAAFLPALLVAAVAVLP